MIWWYDRNTAETDVKSQVICLSFHMSMEWGREYLCQSISLYVLNCLLYAYYQKYEGSVVPDKIQSVQCWTATQDVSGTSHLLSGRGYIWRGSEICFGIYCGGHIFRQYAGSEFSFHKCLSFWGLRPPPPPLSHPRPLLLIQFQFLVFQTYKKNLGSVSSPGAWVYRLLKSFCLSLHWY